MKSATSVPEDVFRAIDQFAKDHKVFVKASKEYLEMVESKEVL